MINVKKNSMGIPGANDSLIVNVAIEMSINCICNRRDHNGDSHVINVSLTHYYRYFMRAMAT